MSNIHFIVGLCIGLSCTLIANVCDRLTYNYVKCNTFGRNQNQIGPASGQPNIEAADQELSDQQKELLKIPLNAVRFSLITVLPLMFFAALRLLINDNLMRMTIILSFLCIMQGSRIVIILTCLHKATEANQAEISQAKRRADRQEWERLNSFKAKQLRQQTQAQAQASGPQPSTSSSASQDAGSLPPLRNQRQILDPEVLEAIMEEESSV